MSSLMVIASVGRGALRRGEGAAPGAAAGHDDPQQLRRHRDGPPGHRRSRRAGRPTFYMDESNTVLGDDLLPDQARLRRDGQARAARALAGRLLQRPGEDGGDVPHASTASAGSSPATSPPSRRTGRSPSSAAARCASTAAARRSSPRRSSPRSRRTPASRTRSSSACPTSAGGSAWPPSSRRAPAPTSRSPLVDAHCRAHLAGYKVPRQLHVVAELVRQPSGKPDYRWAREVALARSAPEEDAMYHRLHARGEEAQGRAARLLRTSS